MINLPKSDSKQARIPARDPNEREKQIISDAVLLAEKQIRDGTAKAQVLCHYLSKSSEIEKLKVQKLQAEIKMLEAKARALEAQANSNQATMLVIDALKGYGAAYRDD